MNQFLTVCDIASKWEVSPRKIQLYCKEGRIPGAFKQGGVWFIPSQATRPIHLKPGVKTKPIEPPLRVLSLFSGCGGMDLGFEGGFSVLNAAINKKINPDWNSRTIDKHWTRLQKTRFQTVFANDIRADAKSAWLNYFRRRGTPSTTYYLESIVDLVKLQKENNLPIFPSNIDVITGGFPCQDFSVAGKRKGFDSDKSHTGKNKNLDNPSIENRGQLYIWMREVIALVQPRVFIAENVKGLTNLNDVKEIIEHDFANVCDGGYLVIPARVLNAAEFGVPQNRERVIFYGFKKSALKSAALAALTSLIIPSEYDPYPIPTHATFPIADYKPLVTTRQALDGLAEPQQSNDPAQQKYSKAKFMGKHCQGQIEINLDGVGPTIRSEHHGNIEYRRLSPENGGTHHDELAAGLPERRLTIRECARLQTFPDDYDFILPAVKGLKNVSASDAYKLIGNAVPPLLGYHLAKRLENNWDIYFKK